SERAAGHSRTAAKGHCRNDDGNAWFSGSAVGLDAGRTGIEAERLWVPDVAGRDDLAHRSASRHCAADLSGTEQANVCPEHRAEPLWRGAAWLCGHDQGNRNAPEPDG